MKKTIVFLTVLLSLLAMSLNVWADYYKATNVVVNNQLISSQGLIVNNRTLVPMRGIFEKLGYDVVWYQDQKIACFDGYDYCIMARVGDDYFLTVSKVTGVITQYTPDVPHQLINGHFYVPIRALSEASNIDIGWDGISYTVYVSKDNNYQYKIAEEEPIVQDNKYYYDDTLPNYEYPVIDEQQFYDENTELNKLLDEILDEIIDINSNDFDKVLAVHNYMVLNTRYNEDHYNNNAVTFEDCDAYHVLKNHTGVCSGYALATQALLNRAGVECIYVTGDAGSGNDWGGHAWNIVNIDGKYYQLDVTWDDPIGIDDDDFICWDYFLVSDNTLSKNHRWVNTYPKCPKDYDFEPPFDYFERKYADYYYDEDDTYEWYDDDNRVDDDGEGYMDTEESWADEDDEWYVDSEDNWKDEDDEWYVDTEDSWEDNDNEWYVDSEDNWKDEDDEWYVDTEYSWIDDDDD